MTPFTIAGACVLAALGSLNCATLVGERAATGLQSAACPELRMGTAALQAEYSGTASIDAQVGAFVLASAGLADAARDAEAAAAKACRGIGRDIGLQAAAMRKNDDSPGADASAACGAVAAKIDEILRAGASVKVDLEPPSCRVNADARAACDAACDIEIDPGYIVAHCEPGKLSGTCEGTCGGRCEGTCEGDCAGRCAAEGPGGQCAGRCAGECRGECEGTCHARCEGEWRAPKCAADIKPPRASGACNASCEAHAEIEASCTPAKVDVQTSAETQQMIALVGSLRTHLPELLRAELAIGKRLIGHAQTLVEVGAQLPDIVAEAGGRAMSCIAASADAAATASASFKVTVEASASVTGRVGASAGASGRAGAR